MTCIVGIKAKDKIHIGGDSACSDGHNVTILTESKVFTMGEFLIGFSGSPRTMQLVRYAFRPPHHDPSMDDMTYLVGPFIDELRAMLKTKGAGQTENGAEKCDSFLMLGYRGGLYIVESNYQLILSDKHYAAMGSGGYFALGSLYGTAKMSAAKRIELALAAAAEHCTTVRAPFVIEAQ